MKKFSLKKKLATLALAAGLAVGLAPVTALVEADSASAVTKTQCFTWYGQNTGSYTWTLYKTCYYDYSWWEEVNYPWPRDGWYYVAIPKTA